MRLSILLCTLFLLGCGYQQKFVDGDVSLSKLRAIQSREYKVQDLPGVMRGVVASMQDLGFIVQEVNASQGVITGEKKSGYSMVMQVTTQEVSDGSVLVHVHTTHEENTIASARIYQNFFDVLSKSLAAQPL